MPRFLVERTFPEGLHIPVDAQGGDVCMSVVGTNAKSGVTWVHSYVTEDLKKTFCIYDAPNPEGIRESAQQQPADRLDHGGERAGSVLLSRVRRARSRVLADARLLFTELGRCQSRPHGFVACSPAPGCRPA